MPRVAASIGHTPRCSLRHSRTTSAPTRTTPAASRITSSSIDGQRRTDRPGGVVERGPRAGELPAPRLARVQEPEGVAGLRGLLGHHRGEAHRGPGDVADAHRSTRRSRRMRASARAGPAVTPTSRAVDATSRNAVATPCRSLRPAQAAAAVASDEQPLGEVHPEVVGGREEREQQDHPPGVLLARPRPGRTPHRDEGAEPQSVGGQQRRGRLVPDDDLHGVGHPDQAGEERQVRHLAVAVDRRDVPLPQEGQVPAAVERGVTCSREGPRGRPPARGRRARTPGRHRNRIPVAPPRQTREQRRSAPLTRTAIARAGAALAQRLERGDGGGHTPTEALPRG